MSFKVRNQVAFGQCVRTIPIPTAQSKTNPKLYSSFRSCFEAANGILYKNNTSFFRPGFAWSELPAFLNKMFTNTDKVNTYFYGCSDGEEVLSFIMTMNKSLPSASSDKYDKIIAKDIDKTIINRAKRGLYEVSSFEKERFGSEGLLAKYYIQKGENTYSPRSELKDKIIYEVADITTDYNNIEPNNSIVAARNFWPYFKMSERCKLAKNLYNRLGENSILWIGDFDLINDENQVEKILLDAGFKPTEMAYIYKK